MHLTPLSHPKRLRALVARLADSPHPPTRRQWRSWIGLDSSLDLVDLANAVELINSRLPDGLAPAPFPAPNPFNDHN